MDWSEVSTAADPPSLSLLPQPETPSSTTNMAAQVLLSLPSTRGAGR
ncbi:hypothetical protein [Nocardioides sp. HB32]